METVQNIAHTHFQGQIDYMKCKINRNKICVPYMLAAMAVPRPLLGWYRSLVETLLITQSTVKTPTASDARMYLLRPETSEHDSSWTLSEINYRVPQKTNGSRCIAAMTFRTPALCVASCVVRFEKGYVEKMKRIASLGRGTFVYI